MAILVIAEHDNAALKSATKNTVTAAARLGGDIHVLVLGAGAQAAAAEAARLAGVSKVLLADNAAFAHGLAENLAPAIAGLAKDYSHVLAPATSFGKNVMPRVAALLDVAQLSDIVGIESADTFVRPAYAGNVLVTVQSSDAVKVVTDREGYALYFSRASIPWDRDRFAASDRVAGSREQIGDHYQRHIGIYAYRAGFIQRYVDWAPSVLEQVEALEQLRVLWYGEKIHVAQALQARRWGWTPRPISTRCERCWPVEAGGTALMQHGAPGRRFLIDSLYNNLI